MDTMLLLTYYKGFSALDRLLFTQLWTAVRLERFGQNFGLHGIWSQDIHMHDKFNSGIKNKIITKHKPTEY